MGPMIYLAIFSNGPRSAHWAIFVPEAGNPQNPQKGKLIHVTGNPVTGFFLQFKRNYDFTQTRTAHEIIPLTEIDERLVSNPQSTNAPPTNDTTARDQLESVATVVNPPGRSPNPFDTAAPNCQTWIRWYVGELVRRDLVLEAANEVLDNARQNFA
ncbi:hypothetical protein ACJ72_03284 [Emergomyces africanus]|uniref:Uncharacterized protein n=1 Tax=Emergomyces africanus TaxID=1955775 RepID=A0A1B7P0H0_9EURO|nr:hypothetical protein ACJ72_03284 [Emergomyces africanus]